MRLSQLALLASLFASVSLFACAEGSKSDDLSGAALPDLIEVGKADNFYADSAREFWISGTSSITLDSSWGNRSQEERLAEVKRLIPYRHVVIGWFMNQYIVEKSSGDSNENYGGFGGLTKNGSYEDMNIREESPLVYLFDFQQELAGRVDLLKVMPDLVPVGDGSYTFDLTIGKIGTAEMQRLDLDQEWYRYSPWGSFNPETVDPSRLEILPLLIKQQPVEDDAWIDINRLYEDKVLTVGIHFGWDYHDRYDEKDSRTVYNWLVQEKGFESPVNTWEELRYNSGPLVGTVNFRGEEARAEISLFWGNENDPATNPNTDKGGRQLEADMRESLRSRDVTMFSGHSGPFYGFALANWQSTSEGDLDDSKLIDVDLNVGNYQIVIAEGCDTYGIGSSFALNPDKPGLVDLDVLTSTSYSNAASPDVILYALEALIGPSYDKNVPAVKYGDLVRKMDLSSYWFNTMYGVHGVDDNPRVHPFADLNLACSPCGKDSDCGEGMLCVKDIDGVPGCFPECTATIGCQSGETCIGVNTLGIRTNQVCAPSQSNCADHLSGFEQNPSRLIINELMFAPTQDYNEDGVQSGSQDEYIELVNIGNESLDLTGWTLSDAVALRHLFPHGSIVPPGGAIVVFGGGVPQIQAGTSLIQTASTGTLGLNNDGDTVTLANLDGSIVDLAKWGPYLPKDMSWARTKDASPDADFDLFPPSCGVRHDGSHF